MPGLCRQCHRLGLPGAAPLPVEEPRLRLSPATGLDWVFSQVDQAIILEDDILPHPTFFQYCEKFLEYYKDDARVFSITGRNHLGTWEDGTKPYFFTYNLSGWGWATWKRAWKKYSFSMDDWQEFTNRKAIYQSLRSINAFLTEYFLFNSLYFNPRKDAWDYQWLYTCMKNAGLCVMPSKNLTTHIGSGGYATHTPNWIEPFPAYAYEGGIRINDHPHPDREFQKHNYKELSQQEKKKLVRKFLKNELKFLLGRNSKR